MSEGGNRADESGPLLAGGAAGAGAAAGFFANLAGSGSTSCEPGGAIFSAVPLPLHVLVLILWDLEPMSDCKNRS